MPLVKRRMISRHLVCTSGMRDLTHLQNATKASVTPVLNTSARALSWSGKSPVLNTVLALMPRTSPHIQVRICGPRMESRPFNYLPTAGCPPYVRDSRLKRKNSVRGAWLFNQPRESYADCALQHFVIRKSFGRMSPKYTNRLPRTSCNCDI